MKDKVDGMLGLGALVFGFAVQGAGYVVILSGETSSERNFAKATTAIVLALLAMAVVYVVWRTTRLRLRKREAVKVARMNVFKLPVEVKERPLRTTPSRLWRGARLRASTWRNR